MVKYVIKDNKHKVFAIKRTEKSAKAEVLRLFNKYKKALKYSVEHLPMWHTSDHYALRLTPIGQFRTSIQFYDLHFKIEHKPYWLCWSHSDTPVYLGKDTTLKNFDKIILKLYNDFVKENPIKNPFRYEALGAESDAQRKERYKKNRIVAKETKKWNAMTEEQQIQQLKDEFCEQYDEKYLTEYPSVSALLEEEKKWHNERRAENPDIIKWEDMSKEQMKGKKKGCDDEVYFIKHRQTQLLTEIELLKDENIRKLNLSEDEEIALVSKRYETFTPKTPIEPERSKQTFQSALWHIHEYHRIKRWRESLPPPHKHNWGYAWNKHLNEHIPFEEQDKNLEGFKQVLTDEWKKEWQRQYITDKPISKSRKDLINKLHHEKRKIVNAFKISNII